MNKRVISIIVGALAVAIISLVALQANLMLKSIRASEDNFNKNVQNAMSVVADNLETIARNNDYLLVANGFNIDYFDLEDGPGPEKNGGMSIPISTGSSYGDQILSELQSRHSQLCEKCQKNNPLDIGMSYDFVNLDRSIEERIDAVSLKKMLTQELANNGIDIEYESGIYSAQRKAYVIHNGQYVANDLLVKKNKVNPFFNLEASPFSVSLFEDEGQKADGKLKLFFPEKDVILWSSMLPNLLATLLFALVILACFVYTILVILKQKRVSEMKTDFINNMTHEFKTPIATISLAADSIINPRVSGNLSKLKRFVNIIKEENKRMNKQVEKVLQMAKIDREEANLRLMEVDMHHIITQAVENIGLQVQKRHGKVKAILGANQFVVEGDQTHIANVINNLLDNANKYSPEAPQITVETKNVAEGIQVVISDQGLGLSKEARKHIFDKFYRVHTGDQHDVKGFGLGLSYVKAIMSTHQGSIEVKSELGQGSDFILFFPFKQ